MPRQVNRDIEVEIRKELTEILYRNLAIGLLGIEWVGCLLLWQLWNYTENFYLICWFIILTLNTISGLVVVSWYKRTKENNDLTNLHYNLYLLGSGFSALLLGIMGSILMPNDILHQALVIIVIISVVGAAIQSLHASYLASLSYISLSLLPLLYWQGFNVIQGQDSYTGIFIATMTYFIYVAVDVYGGNITLTNNIKLKLENIKLASKLAYLSNHDLLTGLYNRRYLEDILSTIVDSKAKDISLFSIFMFDVDWFKQLNDTFGHAAGDSLLRELGQFTEKFFSKDICFRYGGEEFIIILNRMNHRKAIHVAEAFRQAVENHLFKITDDRTQEKITISGGVATYPDHGQTPEAVIMSADKALYYAKYSGRNLVLSTAKVTGKNKISH